MDGYFSAMTRLAGNYQHCAHCFGSLAHHAQAIMPGGGLTQIKPLAVITYK
jgi:hypothetical protein